MSITIAESFRQRRRQLGLQQAEVAALAGVSEDFVSFVENAKPTIRLDKLEAVLHVVGLQLAVERVNQARA
jgi:y4mF family transcriptional regulator